MAPTERFLLVAFGVLIRRGERMGFSAMAHSLDVTGTATRLLDACLYTNMFVYVVRYITCDVWIVNDCVVDVAISGKIWRFC